MEYKFHPATSTPAAAAAGFVPGTSAVNLGEHGTAVMDRKAAGFDTVENNDILKQRILSDAQVMEAVKKLTQVHSSPLTVSVSILAIHIHEFINNIDTGLTGLTLSIPGVYTHSTGSKAETAEQQERERRHLSPDSTQRMYNWNTSHFYPDVHNIDNLFSSAVDPFPQFIIPPEPNYSELPVDVPDDLAAGRDPAAGILISNPQSSERGLNLKIDLDLDSDSEDDEQSHPKKWHKSPLRIRRIRRRDGRPVSAEVNYDANTNKLFIHSMAGSEGDISKVASSRTQAGAPTGAKARASPRKSRHVGRRLSAPDKLKVNNEKVEDKMNLDIALNREDLKRETERKFVDVQEFNSNKISRKDIKHKEKSNSLDMGCRSQEIKTKSNQMIYSNVMQSEGQEAEEYEVDVRGLIRQFGSHSNENHPPPSSVQKESLHHQGANSQKLEKSTKSERNLNIRPNSSSYENIYDDLLKDSEVVLRKKENKPIFSSARLSGFDAKSLMQEEREKFKVYKMEYMRQHSSGDESSKIVQTDKKNVDIPPDEYVYVLRKLHRNKSNEDEVISHGKTGTSQPKLSTGNPFYVVASGTHVTPTKNIPQQEIRQQSDVEKRKQLANKKEPGSQQHHNEPLKNTNSEVYEYDKYLKKNFSINEKHSHKHPQPIELKQEQQPKRKSKSEIQSTDNVQYKERKRASSERKSVEKSFTGPMYNSPLQTQHDDKSKDSESKNLQDSYYLAKASKTSDSFTFTVNKPQTHSVQNSEKLLRDQFYYMDSDLNKDSLKISSEPKRTSKSKKSGSQPHDKLGRENATIFSLTGYPTDHAANKYQSIGSKDRPTTFSNERDIAAERQNQHWSSQDVPNYFHNSNQPRSFMINEGYNTSFPNQYNEYMQQQQHQQQQYSSADIYQYNADYLESAQNYLATNGQFVGNFAYCLNYEDSLNKRRPVAAWPDVERAIEQDSLDRKVLKQRRSGGHHAAEQDFDSNMYNYYRQEADNLAYEHDMQNIPLIPSYAVQPTPSYDFNSGQNIPYEQSVDNSRPFYNESTKIPPYFDYASLQNSNVIGPPYPAAIHRNNSMPRQEGTQHFNDFPHTMARDAKIQTDLTLADKLEGTKRPTIIRPSPIQPPPPPPMPILTPVKSNTKPKLKRSDTAPETSAKARPPTNEEFQRELKSVLANIKLKHEERESAENNSERKTETESENIGKVSSLKSNHRETKSDGVTQPAYRGRQIEKGNINLGSELRARSCDKVFTAGKSLDMQTNRIEDSEEAQQSVSDLKMKLFGELSQGTKYFSKKIPADNENSEPVKPATLLKAAKQDTYGIRIAAPGVELTPRNIRSSNVANDQLLYNYASYKDGLKSRRSNIQDDLTEFERFYEAVNEQMNEDKITQKVNEPKRLSISNVRMLTDQQENYKQTDYTKQWLQDPQNTSLQSEFVDLPPQTKHSQVVTSSSDLYSDKSYRFPRSFIANQGGEIQPDDTTKLPRKVFDDMAYRKYQQGVSTSSATNLDTNKTASTENMQNFQNESPRKIMVGKSVPKCEPERQITELKFSLVPSIVKKSYDGESQPLRSRSLCVANNQSHSLTQADRLPSQVKRSSSLSGQGRLSQPTTPNVDDAPVEVSKMIQLFSKSNSVPDLSDKPAAQKKVYNKHGELVNEAEAEMSRSGPEDSSEGQAARKQMTPRDVKQRQEARTSITVKLSSDSGYLENESDSKSSSGTASRPLTAQLIQLDDKESETSSESNSEADLLVNSGDREILSTQAAPSVRKIEPVIAINLPTETPKERSERLLKLRQAWFEQKPTVVSLQQRSDFPHVAVQDVSQGKESGIGTTTVTLELDHKRQQELSPMQSHSGENKISIKTLGIPNTAENVSASSKVNESPLIINTKLQHLANVPQQYHDKQYEKVWNKDSIISELRQEKLKQNSDRLDAMEEIKRKIEKPDKTSSEILSDKLQVRKENSDNMDVTHVTSQKSYRKTEKTVESDRYHEIKPDNSDRVKEIQYYCSRQIPVNKFLMSDRFDVSDGELTDATDITLDAMVGANRSSRPFSPEATDLSDMEQRSFAYLERFKGDRRPAGMTLRDERPAGMTLRDERRFEANEETSYIIKKGETTLLDRSHSSTESQRISVGSGNHDIIQGESVNNEWMPYHDDSSSHTPQSTREIQIAQAREEMNKYRKNKQKCAPLQEQNQEQSERRRSIKELIESFEDITSPFLRSAPRTADASTE